MRKRRCVCACLMLSLLFAGACGKRSAIDNTNTAEELNQAIIDVSKAVEIVLVPDEGAQDALLEETFAVEKGEPDEDSDWSSIWYCRRNEESGFYTVEQGKDMAQYGDLWQLFRVDLKTNERELLYEARGVGEPGELEVTDRFLYWVEPIAWEGKEDWGRGVMQYELATGEVRCIAEREKMGPEFTVSEQYVVWYEPSGEARLDIVAYDVQKQELFTLLGLKSFTTGGQGSPEELAGFRPFSRLEIVDGGITFFSEAEGGNTYINRYDLNTRRMDAQLLIKGRGKMMAGCFSSKRYIGWLLEESTGDSKYYFYDRDSGSLYCICGEKGKNKYLYSNWFSDCFYFHYTDYEENVFLFVVDPASGKVWQQKLEGHGYQFRGYGDGQVYFDGWTEEEKKLFSIHVPET